MDPKFVKFVSCLMLITLKNNIQGQFSPASLNATPNIAGDLFSNYEASTNLTEDWKADISYGNMTTININTTTQGIGVDDTVTSVLVWDWDTPVNGQDSGNISHSSLEWSWKSIAWSWWLVLQMIMALLGIAGNLIVIIVLFKRRDNSRSTDTLIGALAAADLLTSIFMIPLPFPVRVPPTWVGKIYCKVIYTSMLMWVSVDASIFTLTVIPIERYIAVAYPLHFKQLLSRRKVTASILLIWLVGFMANFFLFFITWVDPNTNRCTLAFQSRMMQLVTGWTLFFLQFVIPAIIMLVMQALTARSLHLMSRLYLGADNRLDHSNPSARHLIAKKRVLQMLFLVVLIFIFCWGPTQTAYLAYNLRILPETHLYSPLCRTLVVVAFCNSCANPIIYAARYAEFRREMIELFTSAKPRKAPLFQERETTLSPSVENP